MNDKLYIKKFIRDDGETLSFDGQELYLAKDNVLLVRPDPNTTAVEYTEADGGEMVRQHNSTYDQPVNGLLIPKTSDYWDLSLILARFFKINHTLVVIRYFKVVLKSFIVRIDICIEKIIVRKFIKHFHFISFSIPWRIG